tara:strand:- start:720 stop:1709 length:990 start_codon:yes stop_codon:yes gene_type:complete
MLEQAIVDAKALREAAVKSAEAAIVEKYNDEVKDAITKLLEQDEELGFDLEDDPAAGEAGAIETTAMEQVPMAHLSDEEDIVIVDLDDIIAAADAEDEELPEPSLDREEVADEVGLPMDDDMMGAPANRDDEEIDLDESELVNMFKEILTVDIPQVELDRAQEQLTQDEVEQDERVEAVETDGMDEKDAENLIRNSEKNEQNESLKKENQNLKNLLEQVKNKLEEINLQNARLLYANRVLGDSSLNEQQKNKVAELVANARSVEEAKMVFETLQKTMAGIQKKSPQSLSEAVTKRSSVILGGNRNDERTTESSPTYSRWATLAAINKTQ